MGIDLMRLEKEAIVNNDDIAEIGNPSYEMMPASKTWNLLLRPSMIHQKWRNGL